MRESGERVRLAAPHTGEEEWLALRGPLESGLLTQGAEVKAFEREFARRHATQHAIAVSSGTAALHLALLALGIGAGDEVVLPSFSWVATANAVRSCGATPVLADVDPTTFCIDAEDVAAAITPRTRAVIVVHQFGLCADVEALAVRLPMDVAVLEDAACAAGASLRGRPAGSLGALGCFSFHPRKVMITGEGGMVTTNASPWASAVRSLRNHGAADSGPRAVPPADHDRVGFNYRLSELQAAVGLVQLGKLDWMIGERRRLAARYAELLGGLAWLRLPSEPEPGRHTWQSYVCVLDEAAPIERDALLARLQREGIESRPGTHAVHTLAAHRDARRVSGLAVSEQCAGRSLALPMHNRLSDADVERVAAAVGAVVPC